MSMSDFVNYFGPIDLESNFRVDADGQLMFVAGGEQTEEQKEAVAQAIEQFRRAREPIGWKTWLSHTL